VGGYYPAGQVWASPDARGLAVDTIKARCRLVSRLVEFTNESMNPFARWPLATTTVKPRTPHLCQGERGASRHQSIGLGEILIVIGLIVGIVVDALSVITAAITIALKIASKTWCRHSRALSLPYRWLSSAFGLADLRWRGSEFTGGRPGKCRCW
jgi:hypothetical protein